jgi:hypothetical protein
MIIVSISSSSRLEELVDAGERRGTSEPREQLIIVPTGADPRLAFGVHLDAADAKEIEHREGAAFFPAFLPAFLPTSSAPQQNMKLARSRLVGT